jgi:hypothetical protein
MGFNKRYVNYQNTLVALKSNKLKEYYGKADTLIFEDNESEKVYSLFVEGKTEDEILKQINL